MSSITGVSGSNSSYFPQTGGTQRRERDTSKIAENVFSKLDTKNQGYLEVTDLETAFGNIASSSSTGSTSSDGTSSSTSSTNTAGNNTSINDLFKKLDSDGDGKITKSEFSDGIKKLSDALETQFNARRTRGAEGSRPPPPPPPPEGSDGADQAGLDKTQLTDLSAEVGKTNSSAGAALNQVAQNFEAADTNQDGQVSLQETLAYLEKTTTTNTQTSSTSTTASTFNTAANTAGTSSKASSSSNTGAYTSTASDGTASSVTNTSTNTDAALFKKALQLLRAYSTPPTASTSQGISVSA